MSWLKRIEPIVLEQSSDIPYVVLENGVFLCASNLFTEKSNKLDYLLKLRAPKNSILRKSTNCYSLKKFPTLVPFKDIVSLDNVIAEGRIIKIASTQLEDSKNIVVAKSQCLHKMDDNHFQKFMENINNYDRRSILDNICKHPHRKYCWTKSIPELKITLYGLRDNKESEEITDCLANIGATETEITWV